MFTSCKSGRRIVTDGSQPTVVRPEQERLDIILNAQVQSLTENFSCTVEGVRINGQVRMIPDSVIWISVNKIIEIGRIMLTPTHVKAFIKIGGKSFDGDYNDIERRWGVRIDFATAQALLLGNCPEGCKLRNEPQRRQDTVTLLFNYGKHQQLDIKKSYSSNLITSTTVSDAAKKQNITAEYTSRSVVEGQHLPTVIDAQINSPELENATRVTIEKIQINKPVTFPFK